MDDECWDVDLVHVKHVCLCLPCKDLGRLLLLSFSAHHDHHRSWGTDSNFTWPERAGVEVELVLN